MIRVLAVLAALLCAAPVSAQPAGNDPQNTILLDTAHGRVTIRLRPDLAPKHAERLKTLSREGFYNNVPFHRVIEGFMAQTGDPTGTGTGKSKYPDLPAEFSSVPFTRGIVGMARSQSPDSANSQFFIMFGPTPSLNNQYTVVGQVVSGMEAVDKIKKGDPARNGTVSNPDRIVKMQVAADAK
jgi:peptidylprolyl isomerase